jgi:hypothetical protein
LFDLRFEMRLLRPQFLLPDFQLAQSDRLRLVRIEQPLELPLDTLLALEEVSRVCRKGL